MRRMQRRRGVERHRDGRIGMLSMHGGAGDDVAADNASPSDDGCDLFHLWMQWWWKSVSG